MSTCPRAHMRSDGRRSDWDSLQDRLLCAPSDYDSNTTVTTQDATTTTQGLTLCPRCHPAWASEGTLVGPGKDTHGTPVPTKWRGRGWPTFTTVSPRTRARRNRHDPHNVQSNLCGVSQGFQKLGVINVFLPKSFRSGGLWVVQRSW